MNDHTTSRTASDPLDELVNELLECGAVLSQMISGMVEFEASGRGAPDSAPIPEVAHGLIRSVSEDVPRRHSRRDVKVAAKIVKEVTDAICNDIYFIPPEEIDRMLAEDQEDEPPGPETMNGGG